MYEYKISMFLRELVNFSHIWQKGNIFFHKVIFYLHVLYNYVILKHKFLIICKYNVINLTICNVSSRKIANNMLME